MMQQFQTIHRPVLPEQRSRYSALDGALGPPPGQVPVSEALNHYDDRLAYGRSDAHNSSVSDPRRWLSGKKSSVCDLVSKAELDREILFESKTEDLGILLSSLESLHGPSQQLARSMMKNPDEEFTFSPALTLRIRVCCDIVLSCPDWYS